MCRCIRHFRQYAAVLFPRRTRREMMISAQAKPQVPPSTDVTQDAAIAKHAGSTYRPEEVPISNRDVRPAIPARAQRPLLPEGVENTHADGVALVNLIRILSIDVYHDTTTRPFTKREFPLLILPRSTVADATSGTGIRGRAHR